MITPTENVMTGIERMISRDCAGIRMSVESPYLFSPFQVLALREIPSEYSIGPADTFLYVERSLVESPVSKGRIRITCHSPSNPHPEFKTFQWALVFYGWKHQKFQYFNELLEAAGL